MNTLSHNVLSVIVSYLSPKEMAIFSRMNKKCDKATKLALLWIKTFLSECSVCQCTNQKEILQLEEPLHQLWKDQAIKFLENRIEVLSSAIDLASQTYKEDSLENLDRLCKRAKLNTILDFAKICLGIKKTESLVSFYHLVQMSAIANVLLQKACKNSKYLDVFPLLEKHGAFFRESQDARYEIVFSSTNATWTKETPFL